MTQRPGDDIPEKTARRWSRSWPRRAHDRATAEATFYRESGPGAWQEIRDGLPVPKGTRASAVATNAQELSSMDELARYNIERWKALVEADAVFTRPALHLDPSLAQAEVDPERRLGTVAGKDVLCLACGGGQQSVAFALLGAKVTVFDLSEAQLDRDRVAAAHLGLDITVLQGDMRDLSGLEAQGFDIVYHPYSLGFVPDAGVVFQQVARVLRPGGLYHFMCANPFFLGLTEKDWNGIGYTLKHPYVNGAEIRYEADHEWVYDRNSPGTSIPAAREFRHSLSALVRGLVEHGFVILHLSDYSSFTPDPNADPGTWDHFVAIAPPWLSFWAAYRPDVLPRLAP